MGTETTAKKITIRDAIIQLENCRHSTIISYIAAQNALVGSEDAMALVDVIEMVKPSNAKIAKLDLFLHSPGGFIDAAYKIVRICKDYSNEFNVIVPIAAKSAATVICLGANEIVMTSLSELGPIDPIIQHPYKPEVRVPARAIKDFFDFISSTETSDKIPLDQNVKNQMTSLFDPYLIGSYQTALKSSKQIAKILLSEGVLRGNEAKIEEVVNKFTEYYVSHSFFIDRNIVRDMGLNVKKAEDDPLLVQAIRQLFSVYSQFMDSQKINKLIGNRERNINFTLLPPQPTPNVKSQNSVNLTF